MATDVDVQFFSHLNGLTLGNNWGDMIRMLDKALVTGIDFTSITAASIDEQGDVHITLYAAHKAVLFQVVELVGFVPTSLNQKYRIKGVPSATQLILKPKTDTTETTISTVGSGKLASLGYDIIFRDTGDVKRVYRAKNPRSEHPFIRVDETISDGVNNYNSTYAKSAMVGLIENMTHIDDVDDTSKLQLPLNTADFKQNWKITGNGSSVIRGWMKWVWAISNIYYFQEAIVPEGGERVFSLCGNSDAFYLCGKVRGSSVSDAERFIYGCGVFNSSLSNSIIPNWFLGALNKRVPANNGSHLPESSNPFLSSDGYGAFYTLRFSETSVQAAHSRATPIVFDAESGYSGVFSGSHIAPLEIPFYSDNGILRGGLKHLYYAGKKIPTNKNDVQVLSDNSMYLACNAALKNNANGGVYFYLGELE